MADDTMVSLTELDVITRWSLAVRQPEASVTELISVLREDLTYLEGLIAPAPPKPAAAKAVAVRARAVKAASAKATPAKAPVTKAARSRSTDA